jgi:hypothetical protein
MAERFAGRIRVLRSKVCVLLQDMPTNISIRKHILDSLVILFVYGLWFIFIIIYLFPQEYFQKKNVEAVPTQRD